MVRVSISSIQSLSPLSTFHIGARTTEMVSRKFLFLFFALKHNVQTPDAYLQFSAHTALMALQIWWLGTEKAHTTIIKKEPLDPGTASLVKACQRFRKRRSEHALSAVLDRTKELDKHVQDMVEDLTEDTLKILSLLTWHFDTRIEAPAFRQLLCFFAQPWKDIDRICEDIHRSYIILAAPVSIKGFKRKLVRALGLIEYHVENGKWTFV